MSEEKQIQEEQEHSLEDMYADIDKWHVNTGGKTIHAKRMPGFWRKIKSNSNLIWLLFFLGPYLRWGDRQAVLFDIPNRQFHIFGVTILPQDVWLLAMVLLFFAILLAVVTAIAGRVWCGFFCFQTVWTDVYTWIEEKLEGSSVKRYKLEKAPWTWAKIQPKIIKHFLWLVIGFLTGLSFVAWFTDAYQLWIDYFTLQASETEWIVLLMFVAGTYYLAGFMREQTCFWLCPYARIQGVMCDEDTILPTYDFQRGENRGRIKKNQTEEEKAELGDCVDCGQCVAVCPTGIDIRDGQQEGCITCALCIDACEQIMDKVNRPRGLIRYASLDDINGVVLPPLYKRPRVITYVSIMLLSLIGLVYGLSTLGSLELKVLHGRTPLYVMQSDGSIQNKYILKILNKTAQEMNIKTTVSGITVNSVSGLDDVVTVPPGKVEALTLFVKAEEKVLQGEERIPIIFKIENLDDKSIVSSYESMFIGPK